MADTGISLRFDWRNVFQTAVLCLENIDANLTSTCILVMHTSYENKTFGWKLNSTKNLSSMNSKIWLLASRWHPRIRNRVGFFILIRLPIENILSCKFPAKRLFLVHVYNNLSSINWSLPTLQSFFNWITENLKKTEKKQEIHQP